jgi:hypothetical protein
VSVESVDEAGCTIWLADFSPDELELMPMQAECEERVMR